MTVTLTYDDTLARIAITATGLAAADVALVERSTDQAFWTTVRGASAWAVTAGAFSRTLYDYEFTPGVANYYRVRGVETGAITFVGAGTAASGNNASVVPTLPAGLVEGDAMFCAASIRNSGTGTVNVPAGWSLVRQFGNVSILGRRYVSGDGNPTITFAGGAANADTLARIEAWRRASIVATTGVDLLNASAQDVAYPALTVPDDDMLLIEAIWKQDDFTGTPSGRSGFTSGGNWQGTAGDDAGMAMYYQIQTTATDLSSGTHSVTGGGAAISRSVTIAVPHADYLNEQTANVTPTLTQPWLKSVYRPFLNMPIDVGKRGDATRPARVGVFDVEGSQTPIAITDVRGSKGFELRLRTGTDEDTAKMSSLLDSGDVLLLQVPPGSRLPSGYLAVGDVGEHYLGPRSEPQHWILPCRNVAAPTADITGVTATWAEIKAAFATWAALKAFFPTWRDVLDYVADPEDLVV